MNEQNTNNDSSLTAKEQQEIDDAFFNEGNEAPSSWFNFKKIGDSIKGVLVGKREQKGSNGFQDQIVYELEMPDHAVINVGIPVSKKYIIDRARPAKIGQMLGFKYVADIPPTTKGFSPAKSLKVYLGQMVEGFGKPENDENSIPF